MTDTNARKVLSVNASEEELTLLRSEVAFLRSRVASLVDLPEQIRNLAAEIRDQSTEIDGLRNSLTRHQRDVDRAVIYITQVLNERCQHLAIKLADVKNRLDRYSDIAPLRAVRNVRRKLKGI